jgi:hypothetical protein
MSDTVPVQDTSGEKKGKIAESTLQRDELSSIEDAIADVDTIAHADHDDMAEVVLCCTMSYEQ